MTAITKRKKKFDSNCFFDKRLNTLYSRHDTCTSTLGLGNTKFSEYIKGSFNDLSKVMNTQASAVWRTSQKKFKDANRRELFLYSKPMITFSWTVGSIVVAFLHRVRKLVSSAASGVVIGFIDIVDSTP